MFQSQMKFDKLVLLMLFFKWIKCKDLKESFEERNRGSFIKRSGHSISTDSTKINRPGYNIRMYWTNFRQPTTHVQQNVFGKNPLEAYCPYLYASLGTL